MEHHLKGEHGEKTEPVVFKCNWRDKGQYITQVKRQRANVMSNAVVRVEE